MYLSLALCNVPSPSEYVARPVLVRPLLPPPDRRPQRAFSIMDETMERWCFAEDIETFEHAGLEAVHLLCGSVSQSPFSVVSRVSQLRIALQDCDPDLYDEVGSLFLAPNLSLIYPSVFFAPANRILGFEDSLRSEKPSCRARGGVC